MLQPQDPRPSSTGFGQVVRQLRTQQALGVGDFSQRSGLPPATIEEIEGGELEPELNQLFALGRGLGMEVSAILRVWEVVVDTDPQAHPPSSSVASPHASFPKRQ